MVLSGRIWPIHPKPKDDELLSSWLVRMARAYSMKLYTFCKIIWPREIWARDIDKSVENGLLKILAQKTATPFQNVFQCTLKAYEGWLHDKHNTEGNTRWIMPLGVYHRIHRHYGLQCCPQCLREDEEPYFRRKWRLAFVTLCEKHRSILIDRCPQCGKAINFHRNQFDSKAITLCYKCGVDLRELQPNVNCDEQQIEYQLFLLETLKRGWVEIPGHGPVYSHLFFTGLRQIVKLPAIGRKAKLLRDCLGEYIGDCKVEEFGRRKGYYIETLDVLSRAYLLRMANWLLDAWPNRFADLCKKINLLSSDLLSGEMELPYWYWKAVHENLTKFKYHPSDIELHEAASYLTRSKRKVGPTIVSKLIGSQYVFRARQFRHY